jgi:hypothetical protein
MRRTLAAGERYRQFLPKVIGSCLGGESRLPYNWHDKLKAMVLGIAMARSVLLQDIAAMLGGSIKTRVDSLSDFLKRDRLEVDEEHRRYTISMLRRFGRKRFVRFRRKLVLFIDPSSYAKARSRGKKRPMPCTGKVRLHNLPTKEEILVPGYQEIWTGLWLKSGRCLGITRKLFSEKMEFFSSQNALEEVEIRRAVALVKEAFGCEVILVADRGFKRKDLLHWLKKEEGVDFVIRIDGKLIVTMAGREGLLHEIIVRLPYRKRIFWRKDSKQPELCDVQAGGMRIETAEGDIFLRTIRLDPINERQEPIFLATSLVIENRKVLSWIVHAYSARWTIETFFFELKKSLRVGEFRVFSSWEALDRLLAMAHMAYLALMLLFVMAQTSPRQIRALLKRLRKHFARPPELTFGRFILMVALDFAQIRATEAL